MHPLPPTPTPISTAFDLSSCVLFFLQFIDAHNECLRKEGFDV
jgi:hypothetical protein